jgi:hypothetical protein
VFEDASIAVIGDVLGDVSTVTGSSLIAAELALGALPSRPARYSLRH